MSRLHKLHAFFVEKNACQGLTTVIVAAPFYIGNGRQNQRINARTYGKNERNAGKYCARTVEWFQLEYGRVN